MASIIAASRHGDVIVFTTDDGDEIKERTALVAAELDTDGHAVVKVAGHAFTAGPALLKVLEAWTGKG